MQKEMQKREEILSIIARKKTIRNKTIAMISIIIKAYAAFIVRSVYRTVANRQSLSQRPLGIPLCATEMCARSHVLCVCLHKN